MADEWARARADVEDDEEYGGLPKEVYDEKSIINKNETQGSYLQSGRLLGVPEYSAE